MLFNSNLSLDTQVPVKSRVLASKMPPRFAKKQNSITMDQPEDAVSTSNLGTEIWESNNTGMEYIITGRGECWVKQKLPDFCWQSLVY